MNVSGVVVRIPAVTKDFIPSPQCQDLIWGLLASYSFATGAFFRECKAAWAWSWSFAVFNAEVMNKWSYTSTPPMSSWPAHGRYYLPLFIWLTLRLLMSYIYIYGAPSKARNANVVYIWTYVWQRWNSLYLFAAQCFNTESMQRGFLCHICV